MLLKEKENYCLFLGYYFAINKKITFYYIHPPLLEIIQEPL